MSNFGTNEIVKNITADIETNLRLFLDKICNKYKSLNIDKESVRKSAKEILGIEIGETRREFLEKEWDSENEQPFSKYTNGSNFKAKWICPFGHKYTAQIKGRSNGSGCPCCNGKKISEDHSNSLFILRPDLVLEWDPENELTPKQVSLYSHKIVNWICHINPMHKWPSSISHRTSGIGCPKCSESKGEKFISQYLIKNNIEFTTQYKISYNECPNLRCDFYLKKSNTCIEFDGIQHFEEISIFGGEEGFLIRIRNDNYKNLYCKENGMTIIRIHHLDINDTEHLSNLISQIDIENPKLILSKNYPLDWLYTMY
jgi:very-short-patch-repair endonuclease